MIGSKPLSMFRKSYFYFVFIIVLTILIVSISSCEKDYIDIDTENKIGHSLKGEIVSYNDLIHFTIFAQTTEKFLGKVIKTTDAANPLIQIDTTRIQILESDSYKSYSFQVVQDSIDRHETLRNYVLTVFNDNTYTHFTVDYNILGYREYDIINPLIIPLQGDALYAKSGDCGAGSLETVSWDPNTNCIGFNCHGETGNGHHSYGDNRCTARGDDRAYQLC